MAAVILGDLDDNWTRQTNPTIAKDYHIQVALNSKASLSSLLWMPHPLEWFTLQNHVNDSNAFGSLSRYRAGDAGLGMCIEYHTNSVLGARN